MSDFDKWLIYLILRDIKIPKSLAKGIVWGFIIFLILAWVLAKCLGY